MGWGDVEMVESSKERSGASKGAQLNGLSIRQTGKVEARERQQYSRPEKKMTLNLPFSSLLCRCPLPSQSIQSLRTPTRLNYRFDSPLAAFTPHFPVFFFILFLFAEVLSPLSLSSFPLPSTYALHHILHSCHPSSPSFLAAFHSSSHSFHSFTTARIHSPTLPHFRSHFTLKFPYTSTHPILRPPYPVSCQSPTTIQPHTTRCHWCMNSMKRSLRGHTWLNWTRPTLRPIPNCMSSSQEQELRV